MTSPSSITNGWVKIQEKTFTRWVNAKLLEAIDEEPITDLCKDLSDGVYLTYLVSYLSPYSIDPVHKKPKHRLQKMENLNAVFEFMKYNEIHLYNIGSEDILEGNYKLTMGLIWTLIMHAFSLRKDSDSQSSMKDKLLQWCQDVTLGYPHVRIADFTTSWNNGMALCAMIHYFHPEMIDFMKLQPSNKLQNATLALEIATRKLKIPQLIDVEDLISDHPDEKSITAYIIEWYHKLGKIDLKKKDLEETAENLVDGTVSTSEETIEPLAEDLEEAVDDDSLAKLQDVKNVEEKENIEPDNKVVNKEEDKPTKTNGKDKMALTPKTTETNGAKLFKSTSADRQQDLEKQKLLQWCNTIVKRHSLTKLTDFSTCFVDGLALCVIVKEVSSATFDLDGLDLAKGQQNLELALQVASKNLEMDASIYKSQLPSVGTDDDALVPFLKELRTISIKKHNKKSSLDDVKRFIEAADDTIKLQNDYEDRAAYLIDSIDAHLTAWSTLSHITRCKTFNEITNERNSLKIYRVTMKRKWMKEKGDLNILLGVIKTKLHTYNLPAYSPPLDLSPKFINCLWLSLTDIEREAFRRVNFMAKKIQDELCQQYATFSDSIKDKLTAFEDELNVQTVELDIQLEVLTKLLKNLKQLDSELIQLQDLEITCKEAEILHNEYTITTYDELQYESELLRELILQKLNFIEVENDLRNKRGSTKMNIEQMEEFEQIFHRIDVGQKDYLTLKEFQNTLRVLKVDFEIDEVLELFEYGKGKKLKGMNLEGFLNVMSELSEKDEFSADQLISSFKHISGGKPFLTDDDLLKAKLNEEMISKIRRTFPRYVKPTSGTKVLSEDDSSIDEAAEDLANTSYDFIQFVSRVAGLPLSL